MTEWIKCSDRLPKCDEIVLALHKNGNHFVCEFDSYTDSLSGVYDFYIYGLNFGDLGRIKIGQADIWGSGYGEITHWQPLPEPPRSKEECNHVWIKDEQVPYWLCQKCGFQKDLVALK